MKNKKRHTGFTRAHAMLVAFIAFMAVLAITSFMSAPENAGAAEMPGEDGCFHQYVQVVKDSTCTEGGYIAHSCSVCGALKVEETLPERGHTPGEWEIVVEAKPGAAGKMVQKCTSCGKEMAYASYVIND